MFWHKNKKTGNDKSEIKALRQALEQASRLSGHGASAIDKLQHIRHELSIYKLIFYNSPEAIMVTDAKNTIINVNKTFTEITGYSPEESVGQKPSFLQSGKHDANFYQNFWEQLNSTGKWEGEIWNRKKNSEIYPEWLAVNALHDEDGNITNYIGIFSDITVLKKQTAQLEQYANLDPLTGLFNRRTCYEQLTSILESAKITKTKVALLFMDLDHFKEVNDQYGHHAGDSLLKEVATRFKDSVRKTDIVARIAGDEFTIILDKVGNVSNCLRIANKIITKFQDPIIINNVKCSVGISIGISIFPEHAKQPQELIDVADKAMYQSKKNGRNRVTLAGK